MNNSNQILWNDFLDILRQEDIVVKIDDRCHHVDYFRIKDDCISVIWDRIYKKEFNENITVYDNVYSVNYRVFDEVETGEVEEYYGMDGYIHHRKLTKKVETYKLIKIKFKIYSLYKSNG